MACALTNMQVHSEAGDREVIRTPRLIRTEVIRTEMLIRTEVIRTPRLIRAER